VGILRAEDGSLIYHGVLEFWVKTCKGKLWFDVNGVKAWFMVSLF
jgi:hypothetical protein